MVYYLHVLLLAPFYSLVSILLRRDQDREILLLRQQLLILSRKLSRKPPYGRLEKLALLLAGLRLSKRCLAKALLIVQPDSLLRWHRELVRRHWTFRQKRRPGRPPLAERVQEWVLRLARENPHWGRRNPRRDVEAGAEGESQHGRASASASGAETSTRPSAITYLVAVPRPIQRLSGPATSSPSPRLDCGRYVLFFMELGRWRLLLFNLTERPQAEWVVQQVRNLSVQHD